METSSIWPADLSRTCKQMVSHQSKHNHKIEIMFLTPSLEPVPLVLYSSSDLISVLSQISRICVESLHPSKGFVELTVQDLTPVKHISANVHFYYYFLFFFCTYAQLHLDTTSQAASCCVTAGFTQLQRISSSWLAMRRRETQESRSAVQSRRVSRERQQGVRSRLFKNTSNMHPPHPPKNPHRPKPTAS